MDSYSTWKKKDILIGDTTPTNLGNITLNGINPKGHVLSYIE